MSHAARDGKVDEFIACVRGARTQVLRLGDTWDAHNTFLDVLNADDLATMATRILSGGPLTAESAKQILALEVRLAKPPIDEVPHDIYVRYLNKRELFDQAVFNAMRDAMHAFTPRDVVAVRGVTEFFNTCAQADYHSTSDFAKHLVSGVNNALESRMLSGKITHDDIDYGFAVLQAMKRLRPGNEITEAVIETVTDGLMDPGHFVHIALAAPYVASLRDTSHNFKFNVTRVENRLGQHLALYAEDPADPAALRLVAHFRQGRGDAPGGVAFYTLVDEGQGADRRPVARSVDTSDIGLIDKIAYAFLLDPPEKPNWVAPIAEKAFGTLTAQP